MLGHFTNIIKNIFLFLFNMSNCRNNNNIVMKFSWCISTYPCIHIFAVMLRKSYREFLNVTRIAWRVGLVNKYLIALLYAGRGKCCQECEYTNVSAGYDLMNRASPDTSSCFPLRFAQENESASVISHLLFRMCDSVYGLIDNAIRHRKWGMIEERMKSGRNYFN